MERRLHSYNVLLVIDTSVGIMLLLYLFYCFVVVTHCQVEHELFGCLSHPHHASLISTFGTIQHCAILTFCVNTNITTFPHTVCGLINSQPTSELISWSVIQHKNKALKWTIPVFNVIRNDVKCSMSMVIWKSGEGTNKMCGYYLPWEKLSTGSVTIQQQILIKQKSEFLFFFESISLPAMVDKQQINLILATETMTSSFIDSMKWNYFIVASNVMKILTLNITRTIESNSLRMDIYDGPASVVPLLTTINKETGDNRKIIDSSSYQVLLIVTLVDALKKDLITIHTSEITVTTFNKNKCIGASFFMGDRDRLSCHRHFPDNGIEHIAVYSAQHLITILQFVFTGPDTHSNSLSTLCQYGGVWILASDSPHFTSVEVLMNYCWNKLVINKNKGTLSVESDKNYTAIVSIQYNAVSHIRLEYATSKLKGKYMRIQHVPSNTEIDLGIVHPYKAYITFDNITSVRNVSVVATRKSNSIFPYKFYSKFALYAPYESCSCEVTFHHIPEEEIINVWCHEKKNLYRTMSKTAIKVSGYYVTRIAMVYDVTINCEHCMTQGVLQLQYHFDNSYIKYKDHVISTGGIGKLWHRKYPHFIYDPKIYRWTKYDKNFNLYVNVTSTLDVKEADTLNVSFIECINNTLSKTSFYLDNLESMMYMPSANSEVIIIYLETKLLMNLDDKIMSREKAIAHITYATAEEKHNLYLQQHNKR